MVLYTVRLGKAKLYRTRIQKAWGHTAHRGWARHGAPEPPGPNRDKPKHPLVVWMRGRESKGLKSRRRGVGWANFLFVWTGLLRQ